jgi:hypothetical protein
VALLNNASAARGLVTNGKRLFLSLIVSIATAVLLLELEKATNSKALFYPQLPGYFAFVSIWGVHSGEGNSVEGLMVFCVANALVYWPVVFGLNFLLRNKAPS